VNGFDTMLSGRRRLPASGVPAQWRNGMLLPHVPVPLLAAFSPDGLLHTASDTLVDLVGAGFGIYVLIGGIGTLVVYAWRISGRLMVISKNRERPGQPGEPGHQDRSDARYWV
jgi:hypothetical protein